MNVKKIVAEWLKSNGYHGLVCTEVPCGCLVDDLMPCGELCPDCKPGHKETVGPEVECGCDGQGTEHWHVTDAYVPTDQPELWVCECGAVCDPSSLRLSSALFPAWLCREPDEYEEYILLLGDRPAPVPLTGCGMKWGNSWNNELLLTKVEWETLLGGVKLSPGDGPVKVGIRVDVWPNT
jgi:hypothetical protein